MGSERLPRPDPSPEDLHIQGILRAQEEAAAQAQKAALFKKADDVQAERLAEEIESHRNQKRLDAYIEVTLQSDAADFHLSHKRARDIAEYSHDPRVLSLGYPEQAAYDSLKGCAEAKDLPTYFRGGLEALYAGELKDKAQSLGVKIWDLSEEDKQEAAVRANYLTNRIKLMQEGHEETVVSLLQDEHLQTFKEGAIRELGNDATAARKEKDITAALEGRIDDISRGVGTNLVNAIQSERMHRANEARNFISGKQHEIKTGRFRPPAFVAAEDPKFVRSRHEVTIDPAMETHGMHKPGQPHEYQKRILTEFNDRHKDAAKEAIGGVKDAVMKRKIVKGAIRKLRGEAKGEGWEARHEHEATRRKF